jgi:hypothetical protein
MVSAPISLRQHMYTISSDIVKYLAAGRVHLAAWLMVELGGRGRVR